MTERYDLSGFDAWSLEIVVVVHPLILVQGPVTGCAIGALVVSR
jgi:hypothetical protein